MNLPQRYRVTPPGGEPFSAVMYLRDDNTVTVRTNRSGQWREEPEWVADLLLPEQALNEWDVVKLASQDDAGFDPNQPRKPEGDPEGGQWTAEFGEIEAELDKSLKGQQYDLEKIIEHDDPEYLIDPDDTPAELEKELKAFHEASVTEPLSIAEQRALRNYSGSSYVDVNTALRGNPAVAGKIAIISRLDSAIAKASLPEEITVYRGITPTLAKKLKPGTEFVDNGFTSTSLFAGMAEMFSTTDDGGVVGINLPKGAKALPMGKFGIISEAEVLIKRGSRYRVISKDEIELIVE